MAKQGFHYAPPGEHQYVTHPERGNPGSPSPAKATSKAPDEKVGLGRHVKLNPMLNQASPKNHAHHPGNLATGLQTGAALWIIVFAHPAIIPIIQTIILFDWRRCVSFVRIHLRANFFWSDRSWMGARARLQGSLHVPSAVQSLT